MPPVRLSLVARRPADRSADPVVPHIAGGETDLLLRARAGDNEAFAALYRMHRSAVLATCIRRTRDPQLAEDAVHDTFLRAYANLARFDETRRLLPWLQAIAVRRCIDLARRTSKTTVSDEIEEKCLNDAEADPTFEAVLAAEERGRLERALRRLPPRQRRALLLHVVEGWSYAEIAEAEEISVACTKSLLFHARANLKKACRRGVLGTLLLPVALLRHRVRDLTTELRVRSRSAAEPLVGTAGGSLSQGVAALAVALATLAPQAMPAAGMAASAAPADAVGVAAANEGDGAGSRVTADIRRDNSLIGSILHPTRGATPEGTQFTSIAPSPNYENDHTLVAAGRVSCASAVCPVLFISRDGGASWQQRKANGFTGYDILLPPRFPRDRRIFAMAPEGLEVSDDLGANFRTALPIQGEAAISPMFNDGDPRVLVANAAVIEYWANNDLSKPASMVGPLGRWLTVTFSPTYAQDRVVFVGGLRVGSGAVQPAVYRCAADLCGATDLEGATDAPTVRPSQRFANDHLLYAFTSNSLFRSEDGGLTFSSVHTGLDAATDGIREVIATSAGGAPVVFAAVQSTKAGSGGVFRSINGGLSWQVIRIPIRGFEGGAAGLFRILTGRLFAVGMTRGLACSDDSGLTWRARCASPR